MSLFKEISVVKIVKELSPNHLEMRIFSFASTGQSPFIMCTGEQPKGEDALVPWSRVSLHGQQHCWKSGKEGRGQGLRPPKSPS